MSGNHTPTPWRIDEYHSVIGPDGKEIHANGFSSIMSYGPAMLDARANAELIVTAVNSYASSQAEIERLTAENATLRAVATKIDADWTEAFPEGPEGDRTYLGGFGTLSDDTVEVWRVIRAALSGSKE